MKTSQRPLPRPRPDGTEPKFAVESLARHILVGGIHLQDGIGRSQRQERSKISTVFILVDIACGGENSNRREIIVCCQVVDIVVIPDRRRRGLIQCLCEISIRVLARIVRSIVAVNDRHCTDRKLRHRLPQTFDAHLCQILAVVVLAIGGRLIDPAAFVVERTGNPQSQLILDQRHVHHFLNACTRRPVLGEHRRHIRLKLEPVEYGVLGDESDGSADGAIAIKCSLRSAQHLDPFQIVGLHVELVGGALRKSGDIRFIEVHSDSG